MTKWFFPLIVAGPCLIGAGFVYDVVFAGIPYQDPTPKQSAQYAFHARIASAIRWSGVAMSLVGGAMLLRPARRFRADRQRESRGSEASSCATVLKADLAREDHQRDVVAMTSAYALDAMGNDGPLPPDVLANLVRGLREHPTTLIFLAYVEGRAVGIATCFLGFSTFAARPLINIHDLAVLPEYRGRGVGRLLLAAVESEARERGCVKLTLEVLENNVRARGVYETAGFAQATYGVNAGGSLFYSRRL